MVSIVAMPAGAGLATEQRTGAVGAADAAATSSHDRTVNVSDIGGSRFWAGQRVRVLGLQADETYELQRITGNGSEFVSELVTDDGGAATFETADRRGNYFIQGPGITDPRSESFEITVQTLTARWTAPTIFPGETARLDLTSNRANHVVAVRADGLRFSELERIFDPADYAPNHDARRGENVILLQSSTQRRLLADFDDVRPGSYTFDVRAVDSNARATSTITIANRRADVGFDRSTVVESAGDVATVTVRMQDTGTAYLVVGGPGVNFVDVLQVTDRNRDGRVTVRLNTRYMGLSPDAAGVPSVSAYRSGPDSVRRYQPGDTLASGQTLAQLRAALDVDESLRRPLDPGSYDLIAATTDDVRASGGELVVRDERSFATLELDPPEASDASTFVAPARPAPDDLGELRAAATQRSAVATGDRAVLRFDVSGLFGHLEAEHGNRIEGLINNGAEGISLTVESVPPEPNRDGGAIDLRGPGVELFLDPPSDRLYVVLDTQRVRSRVPLQPGQEYRAVLRLRGVDRRQSRYDVTGDSAAYTGYPYLRPGQTRELATSFRMVERRATFDGAAEGPLVVPPERGVTVSGTTTVAPGSQLTVRMLATGRDGFVRSADVVVGEDGIWDATFDFSVGRDGQSFVASVRDGTGTFASTTGRVERAATPTPTPTPSPTPTAEPEPSPSPSPTASPTAEPEPSPSPDATPSPTVTATATEEETTPGFGPLAALAALAAVVLLRRRREQ